MTVMLLLEELSNSSSFWSFNKFWEIVVMDWTVTPVICWYLDVRYLINHILLIEFISSSGTR